VIDDHGMFPPEIDSGALYAGPVAAPMLSAANAWRELAGELGTAATGLRLGHLGDDHRGIPNAATTLAWSSVSANPSQSSVLLWPPSWLPTPANNWLGLAPANYRRGTRWTSGYCPRK